jgi:hypothetical protein
MGHPECVESGIGAKAAECENEDVEEAPLNGLPFGAMGYPEWSRRCGCGCPEESDPDSCDGDPPPYVQDPKKCLIAKDTRDDDPSDHGWVCDKNSSSGSPGCNITLSRFERFSGPLPNPTAVEQVNLSHFENFLQSSARPNSWIMSVFGWSEQHINAVDNMSLDDSRKVFTCWFFKQGPCSSNFSNDCCRPYSSAGVWRGYTHEWATSPCTFEWINRCTKGACCSCENGQRKCTRTTPSRCLDKPGDWEFQGVDTNCITSCPKDEYCDDYEWPDNNDYGYTDDHYDEWTDDGWTVAGHHGTGGLASAPNQDFLVSLPVVDPKKNKDLAKTINHTIGYTIIDTAPKGIESPPLKKPTETTGPFQGKMFNRCDPTTWRLMGQPKIDKNGNPIPLKIDPRPKLCRNHCFDNPLIKGYDCKTGSRLMAALVKRLKK